MGILPSFQSIREEKEVSISVFHCVLEWADKMNILMCVPVPFPAFCVCCCSLVVLLCAERRGTRPISGISFLLPPPITKQNSWQQAGRQLSSSATCLYSISQQRPWHPAGLTDKKHTLTPLTLRHCSHTPLEMRRRKKKEGRKGRRRKKEKRRRKRKEEELSISTHLPIEMPSSFLSLILQGRGRTAAAACSSFVKSSMHTRTFPRQGDTSQSTEIRQAWLLLCVACRLGTAHLIMASYFLKQNNIHPSVVGGGGWMEPLHALSSSKINVYLSSYINISSNISVSIMALPWRKNMGIFPCTAGMHCAFPSFLPF